MIQQQEIVIPTSARGLILITNQVKSAFNEWPNTGLLNCFVKHTSCSLLIQENADPTARLDLETFANRLAPDSQPWHQHTAEGGDDSSSHMKAAVTDTSLVIPIQNHALALGTWQGIYLWEHRHSAHQRHILLTLWS